MTNRRQRLLLFLYRYWMRYLLFLAFNIYLTRPIHHSHSFFHSWVRIKTNRLYWYAKLVNNSWLTTKNVQSCTTARPGMISDHPLSSTTFSFSNLTCLNHLRREYRFTQLGLKPGAWQNVVAMSIIKLEDRYQGHTLLGTNVLLLCSLY